MRILIVGEGRYHIYENALEQALRSLGHDVVGLSWAGHFSLPEFEAEEHPRFRSEAHRLQERLAIGPANTAFNRALEHAVVQSRPDAVFLYNAKQVRPRTLRKIKAESPGTTLVQYCNDNPYSQGASWSRWRHVRRSVRLVDLTLAYRTSNLSDLDRNGARRSSLWRSSCLPEDLAIGDLGLPKDLDVVFAGHYEDDGRAATLEGLLQDGIDLTVRGGGWQEWARGPAGRGTLLAEANLSPLMGEQYRETLGRAKIALCFLSTLNEDTYTRRSFEIPAAGTAQLSQYSDDLASLFEEDREIVFFRDPEEIPRKVRLLLDDQAWRDSIAARGRMRVQRDGHDIVTRAAQLVSQIESVQQGSA